MFQRPRRDIWYKDKEYPPLRCPHFMRNHSSKTALLLSLTRCRQLVRVYVFFRQQDCRVQCRTLSARL